MNIVLGSAFLLLTGIFYILVSGEKGNRKQKGARWIQRWGRKHGWQLPEWLTEECIWQTELAVLVAGVLLLAAGVTELAENGQEISQLRRPAYGQGIQEENLEVEWRDEQGNRKKESMTVDVIEKQLSEQEIETIFSEVRGAIEKEILGENESLKHVDHPLYLREELQEYPVTVRWFSSRPEILDWEGKHGENIREDGEAVILTATIELQGQERNESWDILVFPEVSDEKRQVEDMVEKANADTEKGSEWMQLPETLHGEKLVWKKVGDGMQYGAALLAFTLPVMVLLHRQQKEKEHKKEEQQQMQQDYPEIVTKLQLLLTTGMNLRKSVERIAGDYVSYMRGEEVRKAYEILVEVCGEMERGLGEKEAYEQLGERWGLLSYRTLSSILVQCLQKGSVGVEQILAKEAEQAQRLRRQQAQILGDAKLLASSEGKNFSYVPDVSDLDVRDDASFVYICQNETITGTRYPKLPDTRGHVLVADQSSMFLSEPVDVSRYGLIHAGVQKNVGPAGVQIVIVRDDLIPDDLPGVPTMLRLKTHADAGSLYDTPNCWGIYVCGLVFKWIKRIGGLQAMADRNRAKAKVLYDYLDGSSLFSSTVAERDRSIMNVPFVTGKKDLDAEFIAAASAEGLVNLKGHRLVGGMRASIYNAMPPEGVGALVDFMGRFEASHA